MLELERRTGSSQLSRLEFALWGHTTNPSCDLNEVVDHILDLRERRKAAPAKRLFDKGEIAKRKKSYDKKADNFLDYSDMNMRYLRISGVFQRKGRGLMIAPAKHVLAEKLAKSTPGKRLHHGCVRRFAPARHCRRTIWRLQRLCLMIW